MRLRLRVETTRTGSISLQLPSPTLLSPIRKGFSCLRTVSFWDFARIQISQWLCLSMSRTCGRVKRKRSLVHVFFKENCFNPVSGKPSGWVYDPTRLTEANGFWVGKLIYTHSGANLVEISTVTSFVNGNLTMTPARTGIWAYSLWNHLPFLDTPGEYFVGPASGNSRVIYLWPRSEASLTSSLISIGEKLAGITFVQPVQGVTIDGLRLRGFGRANAARSGNILNINTGGAWSSALTVKNCLLQDTNGAGVDFSTCDGCTVQGNVLTAVDGVGIVVAGGGLYTANQRNALNATVVDNNVGVTTSSNVRFYGVTHGLIARNVIGFAGTHGNGITVYVYCKDILVAENFIPTSPRPGAAF